jgi:hypothetical protein
VALDVFGGSAMLSTTGASASLFSATGKSQATFSGGLAFVHTLSGPATAILQTTGSVIQLAGLGLGSPTLTVGKDSTHSTALDVISSAGEAELVSSTGGVLTLTDASKATFQGGLAFVKAIGSTAGTSAVLTADTDVIRLAKTSTLIVNNLDQTSPALVVTGDSTGVGALLNSANNGLLTMTDQAKATFNGAPGAPSLAYVTTNSATGGAALETVTDTIGLTGKVSLTVNGSGPALLVEYKGAGSFNAVLQTGGGLLTAAGGAQATFAGTLLTVDSSGGSGGSVIDAPNTNLIQASGGSTIKINGTGAAISVTQGTNPQSLSLAGVLNNTASTVTTGGTLIALQAQSSAKGGDLTVAGYLVTQNGGTTTIGGDVFDQTNTDVTGSKVGGLLNAPTSTASTFSAASSGLYLDTAVFTASLPLIMATNSTITIGQDVVTLTNGSTFNATNGLSAMIALNGSKLTVNHSVLNLSGNSTATISGPALVQLAGASTFNLNGNFVLFTANSGNTLTISGSCGVCTQAIIPNGGHPIPVLLEGGATVSQVHVAAGFLPIGNLMSNTVTFTNPTHSGFLLLNGTTAVANLKP